MIRVKAGFYRKKGCLTTPIEGRVTERKVFINKQFKAMFQGQSLTGLISETEVTHATRR